MPVTKDEMVLMKPLVINNLSTNGGHRSYNSVPLSAVQNMFDHIYTDERTAGSTRVRFGYCCNHNVSRVEAANVRLWIDNETEADDYVYFFEAAQGLTNAGISGSERIYSVAPLKVDASATDTSMTIQFPTSDAADTYSRNLALSILNGGLLRVTNKTYPDSVSGTAEFVTVTAPPSVSGAEVTFSFTPPLGNNYTVAEGARVSAVCEIGSLIASAGTATKSSASGTIDFSTYAPVLENDGTIEETWTFTFSNATTFSCSGARVGFVGSGTVGADFSPTNSSAGKPYFTVLSSVWGGTFANLDTVTLPTHDASQNIGFVRIIPANSPLFGSNRCTVGITCESI